MEPDNEKLISQKIRQLEQTPVAWNRDVVWSRVHEEIQPVAGRRYHLAAAAVIGLLFLISYHTLNNAPDQSTEPRLIATEKLVEPLLRPDTFESVAPSPTQRGLSKASVAKAEKYPARRANQLVRVPADTLRVEPPPVIEVASLSQEIIETTSVEDANEERIRPVVGVINSNRPVQNTGTKRKRKLHKLEASDVDRWDPLPSGRVTLAGRK